MNYQLTQGIAFGAFVVVVLFVHRHGRAIARSLEARHLDFFTGVGSPKPSFLNPVTNARFDRFILRRDYANLSDPELEARCESHRRYVLTLMVTLPLVVAGVWFLR